MTTIIIADHDPKVRSAMRLILEQQPGCSKIIELDSSESLIESALNNHAEVVIMEWELPGLQTNAQLITSLRKIYPPIKIVSLSDRERVGQLAVALGANEFISKTDSPEKLMDCVMKCCECQKGDEKDKELKE